MKINCLFLLSFFISIHCLSQDGFTPFGTPDMEELKMTSYMQDKNANAVKLLDYQSIEMFIDYDLIRTYTDRRVKIKILNRNGFDKATITIPYFSKNKSCKVKDISGYIYYLDSTGKVITHKITKKEIFKEKSDDGLSRVTFAFPNVQPGCVIEYHYTKIEKNSFDIDPWFFQSTIPTQYSICRINAPTLIRIDRRFISQDKVLEEFQKGEALGHVTSIKTYTRTNIPAFKAEPYMTSLKDNLQRIEFSLKPRMFLSDLLLSGDLKWKTFTMALYFAPFFGGQFDKNIPGTEKIVDSAQKLTTVSDKSDYIFREIKKTIKWNEKQTFYSGDLEESWKSKEGNSAEINLTLYNLLHKAKIKCYPLLISTRENGKTDQKFPSLGQFNGVDVIVSDSTKYYILDGTSKFQPYQVPPLNILNRDALIIDTANGRWVEIYDLRFLKRSNLFISAVLDNNGILKGNLEMTYYDLAKAENLLEKPQDNKVQFFKKKYGNDIQIDSITQENVHDDIKPLIDKTKFTYNLSNSGNYYFLDPFFLSFLDKNPFVDSVRNTDIDFGSNQEFNLTLNIQLPEKLVLEHIPQGRIFRLADSSVFFNIQCENKGKYLLLKSTFQLQQSTFEKEAYPFLKQVFDKIYSIINDQIIFKKV